MSGYVHGLAPGFIGLVFGPRQDAQAVVVVVAWWCGNGVAIITTAALRSSDQPSAHTTQIYSLNHALSFRHLICLSLFAADHRSGCACMPQRWSWSLMCILWATLDNSSRLACRSCPGSPCRAGKYIVLVSYGAIDSRNCLVVLSRSSTHALRDRDNPYGVPIECSDMPSRPLRHRSLQTWLGPAAAAAA
ncbi:hypothetical protein BDV95DRAFT_36450 [Massariosphaeria phaeospora]|uniref:Uncharacterized protein n=1 Tax=Massariosphaeria phaeospora TaxID=100035 RepID=A0A7C8MAY9_9PLEO|nr:hypothetical protein BDV95DRAFT_36450 [Massariosphaeria phaeospora]